jgi:hypothetical protein
MFKDTCLITLKRNDQSPRILDLEILIYLCCRAKPPDGRRQATREPGGPEPLSIGPAARTRPEVGVCWACHLTYT